MSLPAVRARSTAATVAQVTAATAARRASVSAPTIAAGMITTAVATAATAAYVGMRSGSGGRRRVAALPAESAVPAGDDEGAGEQAGGVRGGAGVGQAEEADDADQPLDPYDGDQAAAPGARVDDPGRPWRKPRSVRAAGRRGRSEPCRQTHRGPPLHLARRRALRDRPTPGTGPHSPGPGPDRRPGPPSRPGASRPPATPPPQDRRPAPAQSRARPPPARRPAPAQSRASRNGRRPSSRRGTIGPGAVPPRPGVPPGRRRPPEDGAAAGAGSLSSGARRRPPVADGGATGHSGSTSAARRRPPRDGSGTPWRPLAGPSSSGAACRDPFARAAGAAASGSGARRRPPAGRLAGSGAATWLAIHAASPSAPPEACRPPLTAPGSGADGRAPPAEVGSRRRAWR